MSKTAQEPPLPTATTPADPMAGISVNIAPQFRRPVAAPHFCATPATVPGIPVLDVPGVEVPLAPRRPSSPRNHRTAQFGPDQPNLAELAKYDA
jgi:hypothetical protein